MIRLPTVADIVARIRKDRQVLGATVYLRDALVLLMFLALIAVAFPRFIKARDGWREDEVRANLKVIQVALERYATDHGGLYPLILYGGHPTDTFASSQAAITSEFPGDVDWLLEAGYLDQYPQNPFRRGSKEPALLNASPYFPRGFRHMEQSYTEVPHPRVNIWCDGGTRFAADRSQQWIIRKVGGPRGDRMWDVSEGQRHPPFMPYYAAQDEPPGPHEYSPRVMEANPPVSLLRHDPNESQLTWPMVGNFYYYPTFTGIGNLGSFVSDASGIYHDKPILGSVTGYKLAGYGSEYNLGEDVYSWYGEFPDRSLNGVTEWFGDEFIEGFYIGPDKRRDGVIQVRLTHAQELLLQH